MASLVQSAIRDARADVERTDAEIASVAKEPAGSVTGQSVADLTATLKEQIAAVQLLLEAKERRAQALRLTAEHSRAHELTLEARAVIRRTARLQLQIDDATAAIGGGDTLSELVALRAQHGELQTVNRELGEHAARSPCLFR